MLTQKIKLVPHGLLLEGQGTLAIDTGGALHAVGAAKAGYLIFGHEVAKDLPFDVSVHFDPTLIVSKFRHVGETIQLGFVHLTLRSLGRHALVDVSILAPQVSLKGHGYLDTTGEFVRFVHATLNGSVQGHDNLIIEAVVA